MISDDLNWTLVWCWGHTMSPTLSHQLWVTNLVEVAASSLIWSQFELSKIQDRCQCNGTNSLTGILFLTFYSSSFEVVQRPFNIRPVRNSNNTLNTHYEFVYVNFIPYLTCFPTCLVIWLSCETYDNFEVTWAQHVIPIWRRA